MHAATDRLAFAPPATPGLLRALLLALLAHALLLVALSLGVQWRRDAEPSSFAAELWSAVPTEAAAKRVEPPPAPIPPVPPVPEPKPIPEPKPVPVPEPPVAQAPKVDVALEQEKLRLKKQQAQELAKQEALRRDKLKQDKLKQDKLAAEEKKKAEQEARKLEAQRSKNLQRNLGLAGASGGPSASGAAQTASGPSPSYAGRIRSRIKPNIVFTEEVQGNPEAEVEVRTAPDGTIVGRRLSSASGSKGWDDAVLKAIDKTGVLPRDTDGRVPATLLLVFRPRD